MRLLGLVAIVVALAALGSAGCAQAPAPLAISNRAIGGGALNEHTPGVEGGVGLNNIGLLIRTWGKVTYVDAANSCFYIDDGANRTDGSGRVGIRVSYDKLAPENAITPPALDSYVMLIGISSTVIVDDKIQPNVRPRRQEDIEPISP